MLGRSHTFSLLLLVATGIYSFTSLQIFNEIYKVQPIIIDEQFHIPQGIAFCHQNFTHWDPKITTLPGLYLVSSVYPFLNIACTSYNLKLINLIGSCVNLIIFAYLLRFIYGSDTGSQFKVILEAVSLAILPPLYFFSFVYYTDTLSLLILLIFTVVSVVLKSYWLVFVFGALSVLTRQTNVVWVAMLFLHKILVLLISTSRVFGNRFLNKHVLKRNIIATNIDTSRLKKYYDLKDVFIAILYHTSTGFKTVFKYLKMSDFFILTEQLGVVIGFILFVFVNESIVVGDKSAHRATLHLPQLLYFLLFYGVFGLPYVLGKFISTIKMILKHKYKALLLAILIAVVVHYNTLVHPYLLADNRHYTFYIWNRWFGKYEYAKYVSVPAYIFLLFSMYDNLKDQNCISFLLPFSACLFVTLAFQKLVDVRYFLVPYIIIRLRFVKSSYKIAIFELLWYLGINVATFYIFFNKEIMWSDFKEPQRIIW